MSTSDRADRLRRSLRRLGYDLTPTAAGGSTSSAMAPRSSRAATSSAWISRASRRGYGRRRSEHEPRTWTLTALHSRCRGEAWRRLAAWAVAAASKPRTIHGVPQSGLGAGRRRARRRHVPSGDRGSSAWTLRTTRTHIAWPKGPHREADGGCGGKLPTVSD